MRIADDTDREHIVDMPVVDVQHTVEDSMENEGVQLVEDSHRMVDVVAYLDVEALILDGPYGVAYYVVVVPDDAGEQHFEVVVQWTAVVLLVVLDLWVVEAVVLLKLGLERQLVDLLQKSE